MRTITAVLEASPDGTLHVPVPGEMRKGRVRITATLVPESASTIATATPEEIRRRTDAFARLRELDPFRSIDDPVEWQKDLRKDRTVSARGDVDR
jgi:hypothetical protein